MAAIHSESMEEEFGLNGPLPLARLEASLIPSHSLISREMVSRQEILRNLLMLAFIRSKVLLIRKFYSAGNSITLGRNDNY